MVLAKLRALDHMLKGDVQLWAIIRAPSRRARRPCDPRPAASRLQRDLPERRRALHLRDAPAAHQEPVVVPLCPSHCWCPSIPRDARRCAPARSALSRKSAETLSDALLAAHRSINALASRSTVVQRIPKCRPCIIRACEQVSRSQSRPAIGAMRSDQQLSAVLSAPDCPRTPRPLACLRMLALILDHPDDDHPAPFLGDEPDVAQADTLRLQTGPDASAAISAT